LDTGSVRQDHIADKFPVLWQVKIPLTVSSSACAANLVQTEIMMQGR
jgi:hypothetical protein